MTVVLILRIGAMYAMFAHRLKILVALSIMFGVKTVVELVILFRLLSHLICECHPWHVFL